MFFANSILCTGVSSGVGGRGFGTRGGGGLPGAGGGGMPGAGGGGMPVAGEAMSTASCGFGMRQCSAGHSSSEEESTGAGMPSSWGSMDSE